jgi:hypothetical protein
MKTLTKNKPGKSPAKVSTTPKTRKQVVAKAKPVANAMTSTSRLDCQIPTESIASRAYTLWEQAGRPQGCDVQFWLQAESQLRQGSR